jgi:hypothetical protein
LPGFGLGCGTFSVLVNVVYRNRHRNGKFTPRLVYIQFQVPVSCQVGGNTVVTASGNSPFKLRKGKVEFAYSYSSQAPDSFSYSVTGKKTKKEKKKRVDGTVTVFDYSSPPTFINCTSGGPLPFFATPCQWDVPPNKPSLPFCVSEDWTSRPSGAAASKPVG